MWGFVIFLLIFLGILFVGYWFLYFSLVRFFAITDSRLKNRMAIVFIVCGVSFIPLSFLSHIYESTGMGFAYMLSGLWLAYGWNMIMGCALVWVIVGLMKIFSVRGNIAYVASGVLICAIGYATYGVWSAFHPQITYVTVTMKNLPAAWHNKTAVQLSDVHLGHIYGTQFLTKVISMTNAEKPDIVFITGDLFDGMDSKLDHLVTPFKKLRASDGIYFVTGNHETYIGTEKVYSALAETPIAILNDAVVDVDDVQIIGVSYPERSDQKDIAQTIHAIHGIDHTKPQILLYHNPSAGQSAEESGINLQLAGHTHTGQLFPFQLITWAIYGSYHHGLTQKDDFAIFTSNGVGTWGPTMRTSGRPEIVVIHFK